MSISLLCGVVFATAVQAGTIGDAMPFSLVAGGRSPEHIAERLRYFKERCGMTNFVLSGPTHTVRISGYMSVEGYRGLGKKLAAVKALLKDDGINAGFLAMPTLNLGCDHPFRVWVLQDGKPRAIRACPADGAVRYRRSFFGKERVGRNRGRLRGRPGGKRFHVRKRRSGYSQLSQARHMPLARDEYGTLTE